MSENKYIKYNVTIDGCVVKWSGFVYAKCQEDAFDAACQLATGLGGQYYDVVMCYPCDEHLSKN